MVKSVVSNVRWTRRATALVAAMAAAVWLVILLGIPEEADARSRYKTVTKSLGGFTTIEVPDQPTTTTGPADPYPSTITVGGLRRGKIVDLNVWLSDLSHTFPDDVDVLLVGPKGQNAIIMSDVGSNVDVSFIELKLDDEAASSLPDAGQLVEGTFRPTNIGDGDTFPGAPAPSGLELLSTVRTPTGPGASTSTTTRMRTSGAL